MTMQQATIEQVDPAIIKTFQTAGHVTVPGIFTAADMDGAVAEAMDWALRVLPTLDEQDRHKYAELDKEGIPRWIDHPVRHLKSFDRIARHPRLVAVVEAIIGRGVDLYFSQIFFKPPELGTPKPAHQDNFYAGPTNPDGLVTAWIALDEATSQNGCLEFVDGSHKGPIYPHFAPPDQPFHIQIGAEALAQHRFTLAPVPKGGVSFHHGGTIHRSGSNLSDRWRRAAALTYVTKDTWFADPKLNYDRSLRVPIT